MNERRNNLDEKKNKVGRKTWSHAERQNEEDGGTKTVLSRSREPRLDSLYGVSFLVSLQKGSLFNSSSFVHLLSYNNALSECSY